MLQEPFLSQHVKEQQNNSTDILDHNVQSDNKSTLALTDDKEEANIIRLYSNKNTLENQGFQCNVSWEEGGQHSRLSKKKKKYKLKSGQQKLTHYRSQEKVLVSWNSWLHW